MRALAVLVAAGQGARLGVPVPMGLVRLRGRSLVEWSAAALGRCPAVAAIVPVLPAGTDLALPAPCLAAVPGGARRQDSVSAGLAAGMAARPELEWVLVHDAARCLVLPEDASAVLEAARATGAALPVVPAADTPKWLAPEGGRVERTLERARLAFAQTPQAFRASVLREALDKAERDGVEGTDCASLVERLGVEVRVCAGRAENFKVTRPEDLARAEAVLAARERA
jgi:2-C-methyl-D-erythritol 4-phosphate cytidylyltransferase/2-C-methyl-D-erythritol 2,4-cyclodiphosphate synthase